MTTIDLTPDRTRKVVQGKKIFIIGDSICRGIYKDIACLLFGNDRLLTCDELRFNRHLNNKHLLFGENIDLLETDRSNSTNNLETRKIISTDHDYCLYYSFTSRIWNKSMKDLLSKLEKFDCIIVQSMIWDLSRYEDYQGNIYLNNLRIFLDYLTQLNNNVIWPVIPPSDSSYNLGLNKRMLELQSSVKEILQTYGCVALDLNGFFKNHSNIRHPDGIHFTPTGHRRITYHLINTMSDLFTQSDMRNLPLDLSTDIAINDVTDSPQVDTRQSVQTDQVQ